MLDGALPPFAIPTTLHDSLMARLDRLASVRHGGADRRRDRTRVFLRAAACRLPPSRGRAASRSRLASSPPSWSSSAARRPTRSIAFKHALVQDAAHGSLLRSTRQQLHAQIAEALEAHSPELMDSQPELFAQHYAEAGLVEKSVAYWGKAGQRSAARSAMAEAAAQFQKGLDQLALLPDTPERQRQELEFCSALGAVLHAVKGHGGAGNGPCLCPRTRAVGAAGFSLGVPSGSLWAVSLSHGPRRIGFGAALGRGFAASEPSAQRFRRARSGSPTPPVET